MARTTYLKPACDTHQQLRHSTKKMGNCLSIKVDRGRAAWVRKRRQRPDGVRQRSPYLSHGDGTVYSQALPKASSRRKRRRRGQVSDDNLNHTYTQVSPSGYPIPYPQQGNAPPDSLPRAAPSMQPMPGQGMPTYQAPVQQAPMQQAPMHSVPPYQAPVQQAPTQQAPIQQAPMQGMPNYQTPVQQAPMQQALMQPA